MEISSSVFLTLAVVSTLIQAPALFLAAKFMSCHLTLKQAFIVILIGLVISFFLTGFWEHFLILVTHFWLIKVFSGASLLRILVLTILGALLATLFIDILLPTWFNDLNF